MLACVASLAITSAPAATDLAPEEVIKATATAVAQTFAERRRELAVGSSELHAVVDRLLRPQFDLQTACRLMLGEHWKTATPEQRKRFEAAFYHFLLASYAHALLDFRHDTVTVLPGDSLPDASSARVHTVMKLRDGSRYRVDYYMRPTPQGWKIVDVIAEGVSYVRTYRADFNAEIRAVGLDKVIERLERAAAVRDR